MDNWIETENELKVVHLLTFIMVDKFDNTRESSFLVDEALLPIILESYLVMLDPHGVWIIGVEPFYGKGVHVFFCNDTIRVVVFCEILIMYLIAGFFLVIKKLEK